MLRDLRSSVLIGITALGLGTACSEMAAYAQQPVRMPHRRTPRSSSMVWYNRSFAVPGHRGPTISSSWKCSAAKPNDVPAGSARIDYPGPGESVYVHVFQRTDASGRTVPGDSYTSIPEEGAQVRAYLTPRQPSGWEGTFPDWFELTANVPAEQGPTDPATTVAESPVDHPATSLLKNDGGTRTYQGPIGAACDERRAAWSGSAGGSGSGGHHRGCQRSSPRERRTTGGTRAASARRSRWSWPTCIRVELHRCKSPRRPASVAQPRNRPTKQPAPTSRVSLGVSAESVSLGTRTALKVTRVEPGSLAEKAGLEPGDVIVEADGAPVTGPEQLVSAVRKSGPTLELTVRDSRTGRDTPVKVAMGGAQPPSSLPAGPATTPRAAVQRSWAS